VAGFHLRHHAVVSRSGKLLGHRLVKVRFDQLLAVAVQFGLHPGQRVDAKSARLPDLQLEIDVQVEVFLQRSPAEIVLPGGIVLAVNVLKLIAGNRLATHFKQHGIAIFSGGMAGISGLRCSRCQKTQRTEQKT
jgi:hypothetical protein